MEKRQLEIFRCNMLVVLFDWHVWLGFFDCNMTSFSCSHAVFLATVSLQWIFAVAPPER